MKKIFIGLLSLALSVHCQPMRADDFKEKIVREFTPAGAPGSGILAIYNINGFIRVEGHAGTKVLIEVEKTISADDNATLELGKKELQLKFEQNGDSILTYIDSPFCSFRRQRGPRGQRTGRCDDCDCGNDRQIDYRFRLDFVVKVPYQMNLYVSTINQGDVVVKDVAGTLRTFNINGPITLRNARGTTEVSTINGDVEADYAAVPAEKSSYHTLNGNIRVTYPASLSADLQFKNTNGDFFTDFENAEVLPSEVTRNQEGRGSGTVYRINKASAVRIGSGGKTYRFETFNGNIYIQKQK